MFLLCVFFFQAEDGIRDLVRSRGLGDVYKRQQQGGAAAAPLRLALAPHEGRLAVRVVKRRGAALPLSLIHI